MKKVDNIDDLAVLCKFLALGLGVRPTLTALKNIPSREIISPQFA